MQQEPQAFEQVRYKLVGGFIAQTEIIHNITRFDLNWLCIERERARRIVWSACYQAYAFLDVLRTPQD